MQKTRISVLVNTYNRAGFLRNCLTGFLRQSINDFEVVIADDGSSDDTADVVKEFAAKAPVAVRHVWHEDKGHRRAAILNKGLAECRAPIVLFTDCDAIPPADLLQVHLEFEMPRRMLCGGYVRLTDEETKQVDSDFVLAGKHEAFLTPVRMKHLRRLHRKNLFYVAIRKKGRPHNMGLNYSVAREHLEKINGYDEQFEGWGNADGDVRRRLRMLGVLPKSIWSQAVIFHQHHALDPTKNPEVRKRNQALAARKDIPSYCVDGMVKSEKHV